MKPKLVFVLAALFICRAALYAKVKLPSVLSDNMVLQQNTEVALWGKAKPGAKVIVKTGWNGKKTSTIADSENGRWLVYVPTGAAGGPYEITISDGEPLTLRNVLLGEVWFCSGQSNMEMTLSGYDSQPVYGATDVIYSARAGRQIRICTIKQLSSPVVMDHTDGCWQEHTPATLAETSATAYFFADMLEWTLGVPVGILVSSYGGSSIEAWMPQDVMEAEFPEYDLGHLTGIRKALKPHHEPSLLYNGQVAALIPFTFKGMLWYQGEMNRGAHKQYVRLQESYVRTMRRLFHNPDAPFYFVQIAPYKYDDPNGFKSGYFNEAQQKTLSLIPNSGMVVTCDIGEKDTIHPSRKREVGKRLAYLALSKTYGMDYVPVEGPRFKRMEINGHETLLYFDSDSKGIAPMETSLTGFQIAGTDRVFHQAEATVIKWSNKVRVWCDDVPEPVAVRYCFTNYCEGSVYDNYGFPTPPFRTDDWPLEDTPTSRKTAFSLFSRTDSLQVREFKAIGSNQYLKVGHHGPAVENSHSAFRIYFNGSGAIDVYSKSGRQMELRKYLWYPTQAQQDLEGAGCDEYLVGKTTGLGGVRLWDGKQEIRLDTDSLCIAKVGGYEGGAYAELRSYGVSYLGGKVDISIRIDVSENSREAVVTASEMNGKKVMFVTGVNYHPGEEVILTNGYAAVWGTHPSDVSQNPCPIGAAIRFSPDDYISIDKFSGHIRMVSQPTARLVYRILAASAKEDELNSLKKIEKLLQK